MAKASVLDQVSKLRDDFKAAMAKQIDALKERRTNLLDELNEVESAMEEAGESVRKRRAAGAGGGAIGGIRWGAKWNAIIAEKIGNGKTMDELKGLDSKGDGLSVYQSVLKLVKKGGLEKDGDKYVKGPNFPK